MISFSTILLLFAIFCQFAFAMPNSSFPTNLDEILHLGDLTWDTGVLGVVLLVIGTLLTFFGRRYFKVFLGAAGFFAGAILGMLATFFIYQRFLQVGPNTRFVVCGVGIIVGALCAATAVMLWKLGVYCAAGLGGFWLGTFLMTFKAGGLISNVIGRNVFIAIATIAAIVAVMFFEHYVVILASACAGANALVVGADCFLNWGYRLVLLSLLRTREIVFDALSPKMYIMITSVFALIIIGVLIQLLVTNKNGSFGRGD